MNSIHKSLIYFSFLLALVLNANILISGIHPDVEVIFDVPWTFNLVEFLYQTGFSWVFFVILGIFFWNLINHKNATTREKLKQVLLIAGFLIAAIVIGVYTQKVLFDNMLNSKVYRTGTVIRFFLGTGLIYVFVRYMAISSDRKAKELENQQLSLAYSQAQLKNLRAQINPHFLFNAFTVVNSLMAEDVAMAQKYIANLSHIFRYSLTESSTPLVDLSKELELLEAHFELLKIRYQGILNVSITIEGSQRYKIPFMSLQPLLDNVTKHNIISEVEPGSVHLVVDKDELRFSSTITTQRTDVPSNGIGLFNLNERFKLLTNKEIQIDRSADEFTVVLPLVKVNE